jgi:ferric-dicitrate binding protein FerR (iron transport regulator)
MEKSINISEEVKRALVDYLSGTLTAAGSVILNNWLDASAENRTLFDQLTGIWQASSFSSISRQIHVDEAWNELQKQLEEKRKSVKIFSNRWLQIAAVFVFAFIAGSATFNFLNNRAPKEDSLYVEYVAPLGSRSYVKLADGSKAWLNSGSTIKYRNTFGSQTRELELTGEAFFEVEKNAKLPFVVKTSEINVVALGTKFNVKAYSEEKTIETTLIEGSVKLESDVVKLTGNIVLSPNQKAVYTKKAQSAEQAVLPSTPQYEPAETVAKPKLEIEKAVQPEPIISWKDERWIINNEKLGDLAIKLERRFAVNIIFDNDILKEYSFGGTLEDETLEQVLSAISFTSPIKYAVDNKTVYIMADGQKMDKFKKLLME